MSVGHNEQDTTAEWHELVLKLNGVVGAPTRTQAQWKQRLQEWRYTLNMKHRLLVVDANATGGGQATAKPLKDFEARAIAVFNPVTTTGNPQLLVEAGIMQPFQLPAPIVVEAIVDKNVWEMVDEAHTETEQVQAINSSSPAAPQAPKHRKKNHANTVGEDKFDRTLRRIEEIENRRAQEAREERRENQQVILQAVNSFSDAMNNLAHAVMSNRQSNDQ